MLEQLNRLPQVTKNILLLNVLLFFITFLFQAKGIDLIPILGTHYINSPFFEPYQIVTHFFMHGGFMHILMNMFVLVIFGPILEKMWGAKRFFILYVVSAFGAYALYNIIGFYEIMKLKEVIEANGEYIQDVDKFLKATNDPIIFNQFMSPYREYALLSYTPMVGASGAVFGVMAAFAYLFPNTPMFIMFIPFPIKAKYLIGGYFAYEVYNSFTAGFGGGVAHLAHVGGAIVGFILVLVWNKYNRKDFY